MLTIALIGALSLYLYPTEDIQETISEDIFLPLNTFAELSHEPFTLERSDSFLVATFTKFDVSKLKAFKSEKDKEKKENEKTR